MKFKVKVDDIASFLEKKNYIWNREAEAILDDGADFEVTDSNLYGTLSIDDEIYLNISAINSVTGKKTHLWIALNAFEFSLSKDALAKPTDLTTEWVRYLLENREDYAEVLINHCKKEQSRIMEEYQFKVEIINTEKLNVNKRLFSVQEECKQELATIKNLRNILNKLKKQKLQEQEEYTEEFTK